jgi:hypothetical protein
MRMLTRDLAAVTGLAVAVVVSLVIVRLTASAPSASTTPAPTGTAQQLTAQSAPIRTSPSTDPSTTVSRSAPPVVPQQPPAATLVLSSGVPVDPRLDRTPRTARQAPPVVTGALLPPPDSPDPQLFLDPAAVSVAWLSALCWYDYREGRDDNTRRAAAYGNVDMPAGRDPWTLDDRAWAQITTAQLSSACTGITATVEELSHNDIEQTTVNLTATQLLSAAGAAYQSTPISLTRILHRDPHGHWEIDRAVTAN